MHKGDFFSRNPTGNQLIPQIVVNAECPVVFRCGKVAEHKLRQSFLFGILPYPIDIARADVNFASLEIWKHGVKQSLIQRQLAPVVGDEQHIVYGGVNRAAPYRVGTISKGRNHVFLHFTGLADYRLIVGFRHGEVEHISGLNICDFHKNRHQFR